MSETTTTNWPALTGTPKQITWATGIRQAKIGALVSSLTRDLADLPGADRIIAAHITAALRTTDAGLWINLRRDAVTPANILTYYATQADRDAITAMTRRAAALRAARDQIAALRQRGLTVRHIAAHLGVHTSTVYRWAAGRAVPSEINAGRLADLDQSTRPANPRPWRKN